LKRRHLAGCREGIWPSQVGAMRPHDSRSGGGATSCQCRPSQKGSQQTQM